MAKYILTLIGVLFFLQAHSQNRYFSSEQKFLYHLDSLKSIDQKIAYLEYLRNENNYPDNDTLTLETGFSLMKLQHFEKANELFSSVHRLRNNNRFRIAYGNSLLNSKKYPEFEKVFASWPETNDTNVLIQKLSSRVLAGHADDSTLKVLRNYINLSVTDKSLKEKSPALAGVYSAIIPGMGKLYCGKTNQFVTALIANLALGFQTWEAGVKDGTNSARFIVSGILFSFTYIGNIWGSVLTAKKYHYENYKQLEYEILDYNNSVAYQYSN